MIRIMFFIDTKTDINKILDIQKKLPPNYLPFTTTSVTTFVTELNKNRYDYFVYDIRSYEIKEEVNSVLKYLKYAFKKVIRMYGEGNTNQLSIKENTTHCLYFELLCKENVYKVFDIKEEEEKDTKPQVTKFRKIPGEESLYMVTPELTVTYTDTHIFFYLHKKHVIRLCMHIGKNIDISYLERYMESDRGKTQYENATEAVIQNTYYSAVSLRKEQTHR